MEVKLLLYNNWLTESNNQKTEYRVQCRSFEYGEKKITSIFMQINNRL